MARQLEKPDGQGLAVNVSYTRPRQRFNALWY